MENAAMHIKILKYTTYTNSNIKVIKYTLLKYDTMHKKYFYFWKFKYNFSHFRLLCHFPM